MLLKCLAIGFITGFGNLVFRSGGEFKSPYVSKLAKENGIK